MPGLTVARRTAGPAASRPLAPDQLGRIVVARFLELSLRTFECRVHALERTPRYRELRAIIRPENLSGVPPAAAGLPRASNLLAIVRLCGDGMVLRYTDLALDREYLFQEAALAHLLERGDLELTRLVGRLRLVNTRNRLTHAVVLALLDVQRDYVLTGDSLRLNPLSQAALSARLRASGACPVDADPSRISRLLRRLAVQLPSGEVVALRSLCPKARDLHCLYVSQVLKQEQANMVEDRTLMPMTDREIATAVDHAFEVRPLPRTVAYIRQTLGIPGRRERGRRPEYLTMTVGFSPVLPLTAETLRDYVPSVSGVYELRHPLAVRSTCPILYIGSARDLRKRLTDHLRGWNDNALLQAHVRGGVRFRYRPVAAHWRELERAAYRAFCATFGAPPPCNRISP